MIKTRLLPIILFLGGVCALYGQGKHFVSENFYVDAAGFVYIATSDTVHIEGNMTTVRNTVAAQRGMLSFAGTAGWVSSNSSFVNGYVRSHKPDFFVFPVGQGVFRPAAISNAADAAPTDVAYYNTAQYSTSALHNSLLRVSDESWIVQGTTATIITLSWSSDLSAFADHLDDLCVAGWDASLSKWVEIASIADATSPVFGVVSNLSTKGTVSTASAVVPNSYAAYTLAIKCQNCGGGGPSTTPQKNHYVAGNVYIDTEGFIYIATSDTVHIEGNMTTVRNTVAAQRGMLSFAGTAGWVSSNSSFVNGYVRSHKPDFFVFPVGQGVFRPAAISNAADAAPTDVAYYNTAQYSTSALHNSLLRVSDESWIVQGTTATIITLSWSSDLSAFADHLDDLCVAGWDASLSKWVEIASIADATSPVFGVASNLSTKGTVSTASAVVPNSYAAYTLAIKCQNCGGGGPSTTPQKNHYVAGNVYIDTEGFIYIATSDTVHIEGNMTTVRNTVVAQRGMLSFAGTAGWVSSNSSFVNGYVRSHKPDFFVFPVGQGVFRPAAISNAADAAPTDVAYYNTAQYSTSALHNSLLRVSDESWIVQGTTAAIITLSWSSDLSAFADHLDDLCVAGWDASLSKWVEIASIADATSPVFGVVSNLATKGSISTASAIVPNSYAAYTLGVRGCPRITIANIMTIVEPTCTRAGSIQFEITGGSGNYAYSINDEPFEPYTGAAVPVPSAGYLTLAAIDGSNPCDTARYDYTVPNTSQEFGISVVTEDATDCSSETGNIIITITGGEEPYTFTLNDGTPEPLPADSVIRNLAAGDYVVKVTDGNDCSDTQFAKITSTTSTIAITNFAVTADAICEVASGAITFTVSGCNYATYTYRVDAMSIVTASGGVHVVNNLSAGAHMLYVSDSCGTAALPFEIEKQSNGVLLSTTPKNIVQQCDDIVEFGYIALLASGGSGSYQYSVNGGVWHPFAYSDKDSVKNMTQGNYHIEIKDDMGCTDAADVAIVTVTLFPRPSAPSILTDTLSAFRWMPVDLSLAVDIIPGLTYNYYENADGTGKITGTVVVFNPPKNDYYVSASNGACESGLSQIILKDPCPATIDDGEGNTYKVTSLAGFCWTENLKATEYADGEPIPFANVYTCPTCPAQLDTIFGLLYDWNSATGGDICPIGWHVPSQAEWNSLNRYDASKLKSTKYWLSPPDIGTDDYGFDARPAGWYNSALSRYQDLYGYAGWWASDDNGATASSFYLSYYCDKITKEIKTKADGLSVRCVMD